MTMALSARTIIALVTLMAIGAMAVTAAFAAPKHGDTRPGWGFGDKNHVHTGPPGKSVHPVHGN